MEEWKTEQRKYERFWVEEKFDWGDFGGRKGGTRLYSPLTPLFSPHPSIGGKMEKGERVGLKIPIYPLPIP